jgi:hypothetical protein
MLRQIATLDGKLDPGLSLGGLRLGVVQLAHERCLIAALSPSLGQVSTDRARRTANLILQ